VSRLYVVDSDGAVRVPFLRGILTRSPQDAGLTFDESYALASEVRDALASRDEIGAQELRDEVASRLDELAADVAQRYRARSSETPHIFVRRPDGQTRPFSRGTHRASLEACGVHPDDAIQVSGGLHRALVQEGVSEIPLSGIRQRTHDRLVREIGKAAAHRYLVWEQFRHGDRPLVVLIGGATGTGKSTVATRLANSLDIVRTQSTDMLREVMRMMLPERLAPALHVSSFLAWQTLPEPARNADDALIEGFLQQAELLAVAGEAVIRRATTERVSVVVEGVHAHPSFAKELELSDAIVVRVMLALLEPKELERRIRGRGKQASERRAQRYLKHLDEIWRLQAFLLSEADQKGVPIIVNDDLEVASREVLDVVLSELAKHFDDGSEQVFSTDF